LKGFSSCYHVCLESEEVFVAGRAVAPLFEGFGDLPFESAPVCRIVIDVGVDIAVVSECIDLCVWVVAELTYRREMLGCTPQSH